MRAAKLFSRFLCSGALCAVMAGGSMRAFGAATEPATSTAPAVMPVVPRAAPVIKSVGQNAEVVGTYAKMELTVGLTASYDNPYDPEQIDLSAEFTAPSKKVWKVNGFYDGTAWKVRFAGNEVGNWSYVVTAKNNGGAGKSMPGTFAVTASKNHGWVEVAANKRYLAYDDGTSFYGVGCCHAWGVTATSLDQMKALGFNTYVYWNGTYDMDGGNALIESMASGLGKYDQRKCTRLDTLINWNESRDMGMILVILPHDYACMNMGQWPAKWQQFNPYQSIVGVDNYYSDATSWKYQEKQYRYIIARWGYSRAIVGWQTVDEISGTSGWKNQTTANEWTAKMGEFFHANDPFKHPTTASHGNFWVEGNKANDLPNTEIYGNYSTQNLVSTVQKLWNGYDKPCIMGETGAERDGPTAHRKIWSGLASGIAVTPLLWQWTQGWSPAISAQYAGFNKFIGDIDFAHLKNLAQAKVTLAGPSTATAPATGPATAPAPAAGGGGGRRGAQAGPMTGVWAITSDQLTFGWMSGDFSGRNLNVTGLAKGTYELEWWDTNAGTVTSTVKVTVGDGQVVVKIPTSKELDVAFKIIAPGKVLAKGE